MFQKALQFVLEWEGGWSDHPGDPGGLTRWGITLRALVARAIDVNGDGLVDRRDLETMTPADRDRFYLTNYWDAASCGALPSALALLHFDAAVNQGPARARLFLQKAVGVKADGIIGRRTLGAVDAEWSVNPRRVLREYALHRAIHYTSLSIFVLFGVGWLRRLFDAHGQAVLQIED